MKTSESPLMDALLIVGLLGGTTLVLSGLYAWSQAKKQPVLPPKPPGTA